MATVENYYFSVQLIRNFFEGCLFTPLSLSPPVTVHVGSIYIYTLLIGNTDNHLHHIVVSLLLSNTLSHTFALRWLRPESKKTSMADDAIARRFHYRPSASSPPTSKGREDRRHHCLFCEARSSAETSSPASLLLLQV